VSLQATPGKALKDAMTAPERAIILEMQELHHWNRNATADALGINRTTLYKKMKRLGLMDAPRHVRAIEGVRS
jgi:DNA-binding NtrC family response regulator